MSRSTDIPPQSPEERTHESFRDPGGYLRFQGRVLRMVNSSGSNDLDAYQHSACVQSLRLAGNAIGVTPLGEDARARLLAAPRVHALWQGLNATRVVEREGHRLPQLPL